jgi:hypothetical protein
MRYEALHRCDALERALRPQVAVEVVDVTTIFAPASGWAGPPSSSTATTTGASAMPGIPASRPTVISRSSRRRRLARSRREADDRDSLARGRFTGDRVGDGAGARKTCSWRSARPARLGASLVPRQRGSSAAAQWRSLACSKSTNCGSAVALISVFAFGEANRTTSSLRLLPITTGRADWIRSLRR